MVAVAIEGGIVGDRYCRGTGYYAELRGIRPRPPCAHVEQVVGEDAVTSALGDGRGGSCAAVTSPGEIAVGDEIGIVEADPRSVGADIAARLEAGDSRD